LQFNTNKKEERLMRKYLKICTVKWSPLVWVFIDVTHNGTSLSS